MSKKQKKTDVEKQKEAARTSPFEKDVQIVGDSLSEWGVISNFAAYRFHDAGICIIHSGLHTREAAEVARVTAVAAMNENQDRCPYGPSEVPTSYFNAVGRVLKTLRDADVKVDDLIGLAIGISEAATEKQVSGGYCPAAHDAGNADFERPF